MFGNRTAFRLIIVAASASGVSAQVPSEEIFPLSGEICIAALNDAVPSSRASCCASKTEPAADKKGSHQELEASGRATLRPPLVDHIGVRATQLYRGMRATDVERIMGIPAQIDAAKSDGSSIRVLKYPAEPIGTTVTITKGELSGVALDVANVDDPALPNFSRAAWLGMGRTAVLQMLGMPVDDRLRDGYGMTVEHMIFERPCLPYVSIFLIDGHVAAKKVGRSFPADILGFALPLAPTNDGIDEAADWSNERRVAIGMKAGEIRALFGTPKLHVDYTFKGRPGEYAIYEMTPGESFGRFTFIDGILTEFADGGKTPLNRVLDGR